MNREYRPRIIGPRTLKTALAFLVVFLTYELVSGDHDPTLACMAVLVCMEDSVQRSIKNGINRFYGILVGGCLGYLFTLIQPTNSIIQAAIISGMTMLVIAGCSYFAHTKFISMAVITFINIAVFYSEAVSSALVYAAERTLGTAYGILVAILINRFLFNPDTHSALPRDEGIVYRLNGSHYININGKCVLITNENYALSAEFEQGENPEAKTALGIMLQCARRDGVELTVLSGFRHHIEQHKRKNRKLPSNDPHFASAGHSEHGAGLAYDLGCGDGDIDLSQRFEETSQYKWLKENAALYGFIERYPRGKDDKTGFEFEPWHYRYVGTDTALFMQSEGKVLEEYIKDKT